MTLPNGSRRNIHESSTLPLYHMRAQHRHGFCLCRACQQCIFHLPAFYYKSPRFFQYPDFPARHDEKCNLPFGNVRRRPLLRTARPEKRNRTGNAVCLALIFYLRHIIHTTPLLRRIGSVRHKLCDGRYDSRLSAHPAVVPSETCRGAWNRCLRQRNRLCSGSRDAAVSD